VITLNENNSMLLIGDRNVDSVLACYITEDYFKSSLPVTIKFRNEYVDQRNFSCIINLYKKDPNITITTRIHKQLQSMSKNNLEMYYDYVAMSIIAEDLPLLGDNKEFIKRCESFDNLYNKVKLLSAPIYLSNPREALMFLKGINSLDIMEEFNDMVNERVDSILSNYSKMFNNVIILYDYSIDEGIAEAVANRLFLTYLLPTIIIIDSSDPNILNLFLRSPDNIDLEEIVGINEILRCDLNDFILRIRKHPSIVKYLQIFNEVMSLTDDCLTVDFISNFNSLEPFGRCNRRTDIYIHNYNYDKVIINGNDIILSNSKHVYTVILNKVTNDDIKFVKHRNRISIIGFPNKENKFIGSICY